MENGFGPLYFFAASHFMNTKMSVKDLPTILSRTGDERRWFPLPNDEVGDFSGDIIVVVIQVLFVDED